MAELPDMIQDLALILIVAGVVTLIFKKLKQPLVLGYIVAGFLVSPNMPYTASVADMENVHLWADIGVMFLLFSLGLDFSFKKILKMCHLHLYHHLLYVDVRFLRGTSLRLGTDGLHLPGWYAGDVVDHDYL